MKPETKIRFNQVAERLEGLFMFAVGFTLAILPVILGRMMPTFYDASLLPLLHKAVRPLLWLPAAGAIALLLWRTEKAGLIRGLGLLLAGLVFGLMLAHDWWYRDPLWLFFPGCLCFTLPAVAWRIRLMFWSRNRTASVAVLLLAGLLLAGALFDFPLPRVELDNRFSPGFASGWNQMVTFITVGAVVALLLLWALWICRNGDARNRALLATVIADEPRCTVFFDAVARVTTNRLPQLPGGEKRVPTVVQQHPGERLAPVLNGGGGVPPAAWVMRLIFTPLTRLLRRFAQFCSRIPGLRCLSPWLTSDPSWNAGVVLSRIPMVKQAAAFLREPAYDYAISSGLFCELLAEALAEERAALCSALVSQAQGDSPLLAHVLAQSPDFALANAYFGRMVALREAQLEAGLYLFGGVPAADANFAASIEQWKKQVQSQIAEPWTEPQTIPPRYLRDLEAGYFSLWMENLDRLFVIYGPLIRPAEEASSPVDFALLTRTLLSLRNAARREAPGIHAVAADLALSLFCLEANEVESVAQLLEEKYFDFQRKSSFSPLRKEPQDDALFDIGLAAVAWGIFKGSQGNWQLATRTIVISQVDTAASRFPQIARLVAHLRAAHCVELQSARGPSAGELVSQSIFLYLRLTEPLPPLIPAEFLVVHFARHIASANPEEKVRLLRACNELRWSPPPVVRANAAGWLELPRFPIRMNLARFAALFCVVGIVVFALLRNPVHEVRDPRMGTQYNDVPLNCLAAGHERNDVWIGSAGSGIRVYDPTNHLFRRDIARKTDPALLSDHILDLDFGPVKSSLAAVCVTDGANGAGGVQLSSSEFPPVFWKEPVLDLKTFAGADDQSAKCIVGSADKAFLFIGTQGHGVGVYHIARRSWASSITEPLLPSNDVRDMATPAEPRGDPAIWVGTAKGLCGGFIRDGGRFERQWIFTSATGLAGDGIRKVTIAGGHLWYLTDLRGFGRIALGSDGAPQSGVVPEVLVTERSVPGFSDSAIALAAGTPGVGATWFFGECEGKPHVARYREQPHDLAGGVIPGEFPMDGVTALTTEIAGRGVLAGTGEGAWYFGESGDVVPWKAKIDGGFVGPENVAVEEAALVGTQAILKTRSKQGTSMLLRAQRADTLPWRWETLVGAGRFPGLAAADLSACAGGDGRVYFGTKGKGIGVWDRRAMEVRLELHSSSATSGGKLRHDTTLDLALAGSALVQVTGDHALDVIKSGAPFSFIPPSRAPMAAQSIVAATAKGSLFVCASESKVGVYDLQLAEWSELDALPGIVRLEVSAELVWALTNRRELHFHPLRGGVWARATGDVIAMAASADAAFALTQASREAAAIRSFNGTDGALLFAFEPKPLRSGQSDWRHAAELGDVLYLAGSSRALHAYSLSTRQWNSDGYAFPSEMGTVAELFTSGAALWIVDSNRALFRFAPGLEQQFKRVERNVERVTAFGGRVLAHLRDGRLVEHSDGEGDGRVVVGRAFPGQLSQVADALDWQGNLIVGQGPAIARYDWAHHDWEPMAANVGDVRRFHTDASGLRLWVETTLGLFAAEDDKFLPVNGGDAVLRPRLVVGAGDALYVLDVEGRVWSVLAGTPTVAQLQLAADSLGATLPRDASRMTPCGPNLAVLTEKGVSIFGPLGGVPRWVHVPLPLPCVRLTALPTGTTLLANHARGAFIITLGGARPEVAPIEFAAEPGAFVNSTLTPGGVLIATQVQGESGLRIHAQPSGATLIGAALPKSSATKRVFLLPGDDLLRLDAAGKTSVYHTAKHAWQPVEGPEVFQDAWKLGNSILAHDAVRKTVFAFDGKWNPELGTVKSALIAGDGLVMKLSDGKTAWRSAAGQGITSAFPPSTPPRLGKVLDAVEFRGALLLCDDLGNVASFDWERQTWTATPLPGARRFMKVAGKLSVVVEGGDRFSLFGPIDETLAVSVPFGKAWALLRWSHEDAEGFVALGGNGKLYRLQPEGLQVWWSDPAAPATSAMKTHEGIMVIQKDGSISLVAAQPAATNGTATKLPELPDKARPSKFTAAGVVAEDGKFFLLENGVWKLVQQPVETPPAPPSPQSIAGWSWPVEPGDSNVFKRTFPAGNVRTLKLGADGFGLEHSQEVTVHEGALHIRTRAGVLTFQPGGALSDLLPEPISPQSPAKAEPDTLLDAGQWKWVRGENGSGETVTKKDGEQTVRSIFDPQKGRFGWDECTALGGAGDAWLITAAGVMKATQAGVEFATRWSPPTPSGALAFLDVSGDLPAALVAAGTTMPAYVFSGGWKPADEATKTQLRQHRGASTHWRVARDGTIARPLPQAAGTFQNVRFADGTGVWDFEKCNDLTVTTHGAHLALDGGLGWLKPGTPGVAAWWPEPGAATAAGRIADRAIATTAKGRFEFTGTAWKASTDAPPAKSAPLLSKGERFQIQRRFPGVGISIIQAPGHEAVAADFGARGFGFDEVATAQPVKDGLITAITAQGAVDFTAAGDLQPSSLPGIGRNAAVEFFRVAIGKEEHGVFANTPGGTLRYDTDWRPLDAQETARIAARRATLVHGEHWLIQRSNGVQFRLRAGGEENAYKPVSFIAESGLFAFDQFTAIAPPDAAGNLSIGSAGGIESVGKTGELLRLWCEAATDGIGPIRVDRLARDESRALQILAGGANLELPENGEKIVASTPARMTAAAALTAGEPEGWRVEINQDSPSISLRIAWKGQPVFLVSDGAGGSRFAHNIVHSTFVDSTGRLFLGTAGGLAMFESIEPASRGDITLFSKSFIAGGIMAPPLSWLGGGEGETLFAAAESGTNGWKIPLANPSGIQPASATDLTAAARRSVAGDDVLAWFHPKTAQAIPAFPAGKSTPANLTPAILDGTFAFLNLDLPRADTKPHTLVNLAGQICWLSRGGIVRLDPANNEFVHFHAQFANNPPAADLINALAKSHQDGNVYARSSSEVFAYTEGQWTSSNAPDSPFSTPDIVAITPLFSIRSTKAAPTLFKRVGDDPLAPFFSAGRAGLDDIHDFFAAAEAPLHLATRAGLADVNAEDFRFSRLHSSDFPAEQRNHPVVEIAAANSRTVARAANGTTFERRENLWSPATDLDAVFEQSYRKVEDLDRWIWSRFAQGITCTFLKTNGQPLRMGSAVDPTAPSIFSRGKLALDDARGLFLTSSELFVLTPVGLLRHRLEQGERVTLDGLDVWASEKPEPMLGLRGIGGVDQFSVWSNDALFIADSPSSRVWKRSPISATEVRSTRVFQDGAEHWQVQTSEGTRSVEVRFAGGWRNSVWHVPTSEAELRETVVSDHGLWILTDRTLIHAERDGIIRHARHAISGGFGN